MLDDHLLLGGGLGKMCVGWGGSEGLPPVLLRVGQGGQTLGEVLYVHSQPHFTHEETG